MLIKNKCENILIEVDGGVNDTNIKSLIDAKVDIAVSGSYIVNSSNYQNQIDTLRWFMHLQYIIYILYFTYIINILKCKSKILKIK